MRRRVSLLAAVLSAAVIVRAIPFKSCDITQFGAKGDNQTDDTTALQACIDSCVESCFLPSPPIAYRITTSVALRSNLSLVLDKNTTIFALQVPYNDTYARAHAANTASARCETTYWKNTGVLCGTNLSNVAIFGLDQHTSIIDGGGWPWYEAKLFGHGPRLFEVTWSTGLTLANVSFVNSPSWTIHPTFCRGVIAEFISIINPRFTPNTDGFDPDSTSDVILRDSFIDTGDDGISIKSSNSTRQHGVMVPASNIHIYRTKVLSRNMCIGSATFGGVYDLVVEDCVIGDDQGSSPWAIKYKSHQFYPGTMKNHTWRNIAIGKISPNTWQQPNGGTAIIIGLAYGDKPPPVPPACPPMCPLFQDVGLHLGTSDTAQIHFENIRIQGAVNAGDISGTKLDHLQGLTMRNVTFATPPTRGDWHCQYVNSDFRATDVVPPISCSELHLCLPCNPRVGQDGSL